MQNLQILSKLVFGEYFEADGAVNLKRISRPLVLIARTVIDFERRLVVAVEIHKTVP